MNESKRIRIQEIISQIKKLNLLTNAKNHNAVIKRFKKENANIQFILTNGKPLGHMECRECHKKLDTKHFSFYQARVSQDGYLARSNALCNNCRNITNLERQTTFKKDKAKINPKPIKGSKCSRCLRYWSGEWHKDHDAKTGTIRGWVCSNCNMSQGDQRNPHLSS